MTQSHRMGWPAALLALEPEPRKVHVWHVTARAADPFETVDWTHVGMHTVQQSINGATQQRVRPDSSGNAEASAGVVAPPSTTDKPQGVWVKTSERTPPHAGRYITRLDDDEPNGKWLWDGETWCCGGSKALTPLDWEWFDTTPSKQEDDGWLAWDPKNGETPPKEGTFIDLRVATSGGIREHKRQFVPPSHRLWSWVGSMHRIIAYRIVKAQA